MRKALSPELKIAIHADVADEVRAGDEEDNGLRWAKSFNFYPSEFDLEPCDVDLELVGGQSYSAGRFTLHGHVAPNAPGGVLDGWRTRFETTKLAPYKFFGHMLAPGNHAAVLLVPRR